MPTSADTALTLPALTHLADVAIRLVAAAILGGLVGA